MNHLTHKFSPFPSYSDREAWNRVILPDRVAIIAYAETYLNFNWPLLPAILYMEFKENGNRNHY